MASRISHLSPNRVSLYCPGYCGGPLPLTFSYIFETATQTRAARRPAPAAREGRGAVPVWGWGGAGGEEDLVRGGPPARAVCPLDLWGQISLSLSLSCKFHCDVMCKIYTVPTRRCTPQHPARQEARAGRLAYSPANTEYSPCLGQEARTPGVWCLVNAEICRDHAEQRQQHPMRSQAV